MILYYALGGGLGHITRSLAIIRHLGRAAARFRLLVSSEHAGLAAAACPCALDVVPADVMASRQHYYRFLQDHLRQHRVASIILDSFPFGIVGEWAAVAREVPRFLIARDLKWTAYASAVNVDNGPWPCAGLAIEPLDPAYRLNLEDRLDLDVLNRPIVLPLEQPFGTLPVDHGRSNDWVVAHSGPPAEQELLLRFARERMRERDAGPEEPSTIFPKQGIYPAEPLLLRYKQVVTAAGYNLAAFGMLHRSTFTHHLLPLDRRFDDQYARVARIREQAWLEGGEGGAAQAAAWVLGRATAG